MNWLVAIVAGLFSLAAVCVGAFIARQTGIDVNRQQSQAQKSAELRSKLEELVMSCFELDTWKMKQYVFFLVSQTPLRDVESWFDSAVPKNMSMALQKIECLQSLYFPKLLAQTAKLKITVRNYSQTVHGMFEERINNAKKNPGQGYYGLSEDRKEQWFESAVKVTDAQEKLVRVARDLMTELYGEKS